MRAAETGTVGAGDLLSAESPENKRGVGLDGAISGDVGGPAQLYGQAFKINEKELITKKTHSYG
jgi:hypothetical protein